MQLSTNQLIIWKIQEEGVNFLQKQKKCCNFAPE